MVSIQKSVMESNRMEVKAKKIKTSIYLPEDIFWRLKETSTARRMTDTAAMQAAIEQWIAADPKMLNQHLIAGRARIGPATATPVIGSELSEAILKLDDARNIL